MNKQLVCSSVEGSGSLTGDSDVDHVAGFAQSSFTPVRSTVGGRERSLDGAGGRTWMYLPGSVHG